MRRSRRELQPVQAELTQAPPAGETRRRSISSKLGKLTRRLKLSHRDSIVTTMPAFRVSDVPARGTIVITRRHICFWPALPSLTPEVKLKFSDVVSICKEKVFSLFPTGIRITTSQRAVTFSNLGSRDRLLQQLQSAWGASANFAANDSVLVESHTALVAVNQAEALTDDSADSGFEASPVAAPLQLQQRQRLDDQQQDEDEELADLPPEVTGNDPADGVRQSCDGLMAKFGQQLRPALRVDWISACGILSLVLLLLCTIAAVNLAFRLASLQRQMASLNANRAGPTSPSDALVSERPYSQPPPQVGRTLSDALRSLSALTRQLARLTRRVVSMEARR